MDFPRAKEEIVELLVRHARAQGYEVGPYLNEYNVFLNGKRWAEFWRSGEAIGYHLAGEIGELPAGLAASRSSFRGVWDETGSLKDIGQAFALLRAWLLEGMEVDDLPGRMIHRSMI